MNTFHSVFRIERSANMRRSLLKLKVLAFVAKFSASTRLSPTVDFPRGRVSVTTVYICFLTKRKTLPLKKSTGASVDFPNAGMQTVVFVGKVHCGGFSRRVFASWRPGRSRSAAFVVRYRIVEGRTRTRETGLGHHSLVLVKSGATERHLPHITVIYRGNAGFSRSGNSTESFRERKQM